MADITFKEIKEAVEVIGRSHEEFKATHAASLKEKDALLEAKMAKITDELSAKHETVVKGLAVLEAKLNRPGLDAGDDKISNENYAKMKFIGACLKGGTSPLANISREDYDAYKAAFSRYIKCSHEATVQDLVNKTMSVGSDPDGGYWITPPEIDGQIRSRVFETSPMRQVCSTQQISTHEYKIQEDPNELSAGWVGETQSRPATTTPQVGTKVITANEIYAMPQLTRTFLEDAAINAEAWLQGKVADKFARVSNTSFLLGNGVAQPRGLLTYPAGSNSDGSNKWGEIEQIVSGASGTFAYNSLITLITSLKDNFQSNASFLVRRQSLPAIMTLTDGAGRYIFQPILNGAFNNTPLFGYTINYATDMQPTGTSGNLLMAFGDFKQAYLIVDRVGTSVIRDEVTNKPFVMYYTRQRVGGDVVNYDAVKLYKAT